MLIQSLAHLRAGCGRFPHLEDALQCLDEHMQDQAPARFEFSGGYLLLQEGHTKEINDGDYEAHKRCLDVQVLLEGAELVVWNDISNLKLSVAYNPESDKALYVGEGCGITLLPDTCYICWPEDAHKACRHMDQPMHYRKAVIKLPIL